MRKKFRITAQFGAFICSFLTLSAVQAAFFDGQELKDRLIDYKRSVSQKPVQAAGGFGFVMGVAEAMDGLTHSKTGYTFCLPPQAISGQISDAVLVYLNNHPHNLRFSAHSLVEAALADAYPCSSRP